MGGRADVLGRYATQFGDPALAGERLPGWLAVTPEQLAEVAARSARPDDGGHADLRDRGRPRRGAAAHEPTLVAERPATGRTAPVPLPRDRAADAWPAVEVVAAHLPGPAARASATLLLDAGAGREPAGREGVASVVAKALEEGTAPATARRTRSRWRAWAPSCQLVGRLGRAAGERPGPVADRLPAAVELLAEAARTPRLDPADIARVRDDEVTGCGWSGPTPGPRADAALRAELFGPAAARPAAARRPRVGRRTVRRRRRRVSPRAG